MEFPATTSSASFSEGHQSSSRLFGLPAEEIVQSFLNFAKGSSCGPLGDFAMTCDWRSGDPAEWVAGLPLGGTPERFPPRKLIETALIHRVDEEVAEVKVSAARLSRV